MAITILESDNSIFLRTDLDGTETPLNNAAHLERCLDDNGLSTATSRAQRSTEELVRKCFVSEESGLVPFPRLERAAHKAYLERHMRGLPADLSSLAASRPWIAFWLLHAAELLQMPVHNTAVSVSSTEQLLSLQCADGGFAGGPYMVAHLAATYAAVHALAISRDVRALRAIDRRAMRSWLLRLKAASPIPGAFAVHEGGETDVRGAYCALAIMRLLRIDSRALRAEIGAYLTACQTFDGGIAATPDGGEAHGGYTYCGTAASLMLALADREDIDRANAPSQSAGERRYIARYLDTRALLRWCVLRQAQFEGGFSGRPNKLVDGCYSFWTAAVFSLLVELPGAADAFDRMALQKYVLACCQKRESGGLVDKPSCHADPYHTCYTISGLSVAQHHWSIYEDNLVLLDNRTSVLGRPEINKVVPTDPLHNISVEALAFAAIVFENDVLYDDDGSHKDGN